jgi:hypothetical protein
LQTRAAGVGSTDPADALGQVARVAFSRRKDRASAIACWRRRVPARAGRVRERTLAGQPCRPCSASNAASNRPRSHAPAADRRRCRAAWTGAASSIWAAARACCRISSLLRRHARHPAGARRRAGGQRTPHRGAGGGCDAVVCPIDCVSHGACKLAKVLCRRFNKPFLPIPSASRSGFERALDQLAAGGARPTRSRVRRAPERLPDRTSRLPPGCKKTINVLPCAVVPHDGRLSAVNAVGYRRASMGADRCA